MRSLQLPLLLAFGTLAFAGAAYAQVPASNDKSDANENTGSGIGALGTNGSNDGSANTASGFHALFSDTTGSENTAAGTFALAANTTGADNTATGFQTLFKNTTGGFNTAAGVQALFFNSTGAYNAAIGYVALYNNSTGRNNTAAGAYTLLDNTSGNNNAAFGYTALYSNSSGSSNTASGVGALYNNKNGISNTASGFDALYANKSGRNNTAIGQGALRANTVGSNNIALGFQAGFSPTTGSNNIEIGNQGTASDNNTIKIGTQGLQAATFMAGIYNVSVSGNAVVVNSSGQLGVTVSSERFKTAIAPMGSNSQKLKQLRPVTFHLKTDPQGPLQYGLVAEQVARVYPELVIRSKEGRIDGVRYDELAPLLLKEVQLQQQKIAAQAAEIHTLNERQQQFVTQSELQDLKVRLQAALDKVAGKESFVAQR